MKSIREPMPIRRCIVEPVMRENLVSFHGAAHRQVAGAFGHAQVEARVSLMKVEDLFPAQLPGGGSRIGLVKPGSQGSDLFLLSIAAFSAKRRADCVSRASRTT
jgi:hypothetical protein